MMLSHLHFPFGVYIIGVSLDILLEYLIKKGLPSGVQTTQYLKCSVIFSMVAGEVGVKCN